MSELRRAWRGADPDLFRFTTTDVRDLHIGLMSAFEQAAVLAPAMNLDRVRAALIAVGWDEPVGDEAITRSLEALVGWGLIEATQDHAAHYATPEEFERRNLQWSLTPKGEAAVGGLFHALELLRQAVGLQPAVLDAIGDGLAELGALLASPEVGVDARIHLRLAEVEGHLAALVTSVRQFNGHLQRLVREDANDDDLFVEVKRRTVAYLDEFVAGVERPQRRIASGVERLVTGGLATLFDRALTGANLAPVAGVDPGPAWLAERERRFVALQAWFTPVSGSDPLVENLLGVARTAIIELLRVLERRYESRRRSASVAMDFRRLADLFASAPGEVEAHRLFAATFGLWSSRHAHLPAADGTCRAPTTAWCDTEAVEVAPSLRTTGDLVNRGRSRPVADPRRWRAERQREQAEALGAHETLRESLSTTGSVRLSAFGLLPEDAFAELLLLLAAGLDAPREDDGARRASSPDGRVEVVLRDPQDGRRAALRTPAGTLRGPDLLVSIRLLASGANDLETERAEASGA
ncbi:MAG: TIGR02677 family protein [Acidimicrobiia bacterium]